MSKAHRDVLKTSNFDCNIHIVIPFLSITLCGCLFRERRNVMDIEQDFRRSSEHSIRVQDINLMLLP